MFITPTPPLESETTFKLFCIAGPPIGEVRLMRINQRTQGFRVETTTTTAATHILYWALCVWPQDGPLKQESNKSAAWWCDLQKMQKTQIRHRTTEKGWNETMLVIFKIPQKLEEPLQLQNAKWFFFLHATDLHVEL